MGTETILYGTMIALVILLVFSGYILIRNQVVFKVSTAALIDVYDHNLEMIEEGVCQCQRIEFSNSPSYNEMVFKFWIPMSKFERELRANSGLK